MDGRTRETRRTTCLGWMAHARDKAHNLPTSLAPPLESASARGHGVLAPLEAPLHSLLGATLGALPPLLPQR